MKKKVSFDKKIEFPTMIGEITEVSLENNLKFINDSSIEGNLILIGKYKLTEASRIEEDFKYDIPVEVNLSEKLDLNTTNIEISDFYYEIEDEKDFICHIELSIDGLEIISMKKPSMIKEPFSVMIQELDGLQILKQENNY